MTDREMLEYAKACVSQAVKNCDIRACYGLAAEIGNHLHAEYWRLAQLQKDTVTFYGVPAIGLGLGCMPVDIEAPVRLLHESATPPKALVFHNGRFYGVLMT